MAPSLWLCGNRQSPIRNRAAPGPRSLPDFAEKRKRPGEQMKKADPGRRPGLRSNRPTKDPVIPTGAGASATAEWRNLLSSPEALSEIAQLRALAPSQTLLR